MTQNWQPKHTQVSFLPVSHPFEQPQLINICARHWRNFRSNRRSGNYECMYSRRTLDVFYPTFAKGW